MESDANGTGTGEGEATDKAATKMDRVADSIKPDADAISPETIQRIKLGIKIGFTVALAALLVYWLVAYQLDVQLFEF